MSTTEAPPCRISALSEWLRQSYCETHEVRWFRSERVTCPFEGLEAA